MKLKALYILALIILINTVMSFSILDKMDKFKKIHQFNEQKPQILFQAFTWDANVNGKKGVWYKHLKTKIKELKKAGISHVWFPPMSKSVSPQGYMPGDYYDLGSANDKTLYGSKSELKSTIYEFSKLGIVSIADIVINHRTASHQENGVWNIFHHKSKKMMWKKWALAKNDYEGTGQQDSGDNFIPAPDIDHSNKKVQKDIIQWLKWLKNDIGFLGFRFDFSKGYSGKYAKKYIEATQPEFCVGEVWTDMSYDSSHVLKENQNPHRQGIVDWIDLTKGQCKAFDFTTKGILQEALKNQEYWRLLDSNDLQPGVMGWWPSNSVTFIDNHDTGSSQAHWPFPQSKVLEAYAYILTHPGVPTVFWDHLYLNGNYLKAKIIELTRFRVKMGLNKNSKIEILEASTNLYVAQINRSVLVKLGSLNYKTTDEWKISLSGENYKIYLRN
ncbi:MAG: alpha-amylase [Candidatus Cloacimonadota bacterium]|nr:MAG: alpha-amylase [Candidatus Cloacimonadota bacterium]